MKQKIIKVKTKSKNYEVHIGTNLISKLRNIIKKNKLSFLKGEKQILSLGGGAYINTNIRKECKKSSFSFWLNWKKDIIIKRINGSKKRPIAMTLSETDLERLINERAKIYSLADFTINCDQLNKNEIANKIIKKYETKNNKG